MQPKYSKVSFLPIIQGIMTKDKLADLRQKLPGQPKNMDYRTEFLKGRGASTKDLTWNRKKHIHNCCKSKVAWRHRAQCTKLIDYNNDD